MIEKDFVKKANEILPEEDRIDPNIYGDGKGAETQRTITKKFMDKNHATTSGMIFKHSGINNFARD